MTIRDKLIEISNIYPTELTTDAEVSRVMMPIWLEHVLNGIEKTKKEIDNKSQSLRTAEIYLHFAIEQLNKMSKQSNKNILSTRGNSG